MMLYAGSHGTLPSVNLLVGAVYWGGLNIVLLTGFVTRGWHGVEWVRQVARTPISTSLLTDTPASPAGPQTPV